MISCLVSDVFLRCLKSFLQQGTEQINQPISQPTKQGILWSSALPWGKDCSLSSCLKNHIKWKSQRWRKQRESYFSTHAWPTSFLSDMIWLDNTIQVHGFNHWCVHTWLSRPVLTSPGGLMGIFNCLVRGPFKLTLPPLTHWLPPSTKPHLASLFSWRHHSTYPGQNHRVVVHSLFSYAVCWQVLSILPL